MDKINQNYGDSHLLNDELLVKSASKDNWEYEAIENDEERKATLAVAALGNEAASDAGKVSMLKTLGEFAIKLFK